MKRMVLIGVGISLSVSLVVLAGAVKAQEKYPVKPIAAICPLEAGSDGDLLWWPRWQEDMRTSGL